MAPTQTRSMDLSGVQAILEKMDKNMSSMSQDMKELRSDFNGKLELLSSQMANKFEEWEQEKREIGNKQQELETRIDELERRQKRANIIITGLVVDATPIRKQVEKLFNDKLGQQIRVNDAYAIKTKDGKNKVIATIRSLEEKSIVMKNKKKLQLENGEKIFVDDDQIRKDEIISFKAREFARKMRESGKEATAYKKTVYVNNLVHIWDEETLGFVNRKN